MKTKILLFLLFIIFTSINLFSQNLFAQWVQTNGPLEGNVYSLAASAPNLFAGIANNGVYLTTNNGQSWTQTH